MLDHILNVAVSNLNDYLTHARISNEAILMSSLFSAAGALILGRFTGKIGHLTMPLNFSALFIGAILANWVFSGIDIPTILNPQEILLATILGMIAGSFAMLWCTGPEDVR